MNLQEYIDKKALSLKPLKDYDDYELQAEIQRRNERNRVARTLDDYKHKADFLTKIYNQLNGNRTEINPDLFSAFKSIVDNLDIQVLETTDRAIKNGW